MRILILGGGRFQGRRTAEVFLAAGDSVTVLHHGTNPPPGARHIQGQVEDADALTAVFRGQNYDVVVDNLGYEPDHVERLAPYLRRRAGQYILISSLVVYNHEPPHPYHLVGETEADLHSVAGGDYHMGKRRCEQALQAMAEVPWTVLRLGQVEGPGDPANRRCWPPETSGRSARFTTSRAVSCSRSPSGCTCWPR